METENSIFDLDRRDFMKALGLVGTGAVISPALLNACSSTSKSSAKSIHIDNWTTYISDQLKKDFTRDTGIKLQYSEDINDNTEYFSKIQPILNRNKSINRDGFILTDWMANRIINQVKWAQPLSNSKFPNKKNLIDALKSPSFDKTRKYSAPWASIIAGFAYNIAQTGKEIKTFDDFLSVQGTKTVISEMRDTIGIMLLDQNVKIESANITQINKEFDRLKDLLDSNKINGVNGNDYITDLSGGNLAACIAWSGDVAQLAQDNPDIRFVVPESGGTLSSDNFMIPISSDKPELATEFINYFYDPAVSAKWVEAVQYISPVKGVEDELTKLGGDAAALVDNPLVVPNNDMLSNLHIFTGLSEKDEEQFDKRSAEIVGA
ncbi:MAG: spermidine/putrescine ABC transporter substrate-binding protein [Acidimicrobiia bacterium]